MTAVTYVQRIDWFSRSEQGEKDRMEEGRRREEEGEGEGGEGA